MTQPSKATSKLADSGDNPQIGERGAAVTAAAAIAAYTAADISATYVEAEVQAIADALEALRDSVALNVVALNLVIERLEAHGLIADN
jgi:hypothetical protein